MPGNSKAGGAGGGPWVLALPLTLFVIEQTLHNRHRPPSGMQHKEVPARLDEASSALRASPLNASIEWRRALDAPTSPEDAVAALKLVHTVSHLRTVQRMSKTGGGFDTDTYCAPGSWEAMLDGTRAWLEAAELAADGKMRGGSRHNR